MISNGQVLGDDSTSEWRKPHKLCISIFSLVLVSDSVDMGVQFQDNVAAFQESGSEIETIMTSEN